MADDLNDEWWNTDSNDGSGSTENVGGSASCNTIGEKRKSSDISLQQPVAKSRKRPKKKRITNSKLLEKGFSTCDFLNAFTDFYDGQLSAIEKDALSMDDSNFGPVNNDMSHTIASLLKEALPKWRRLATTHVEKKSPLVVTISSGALRALHLNKEAASFKGEKCKTAKLFARHMKQDSQAKFLESNAVHFAIGTPARICSLLSQNSLSLKSTKLIVLDLNWRDVKSKRMVDIPDVKKSLFDLLKDFIIPACKAHHVKIALF